MNDKQINALLEANYHRGVSDGMTRAYQIMMAEETGRSQEKQKWFGEDQEAAEVQDE